MKYISIILLIGVLSKSLLAAPTLYPTHYNSFLKNNTNSNVVADSVNSSRYYVLPPNSADVKVTGLNSVTANVGFCKELSEIQKYNAETLQMLNVLKKREFDLVNLMTSREQQIKEAQIELAKYVKAYNLDGIVALDQQIKTIDMRLDSLYSAIKSCMKDCNNLLTEIENLNETRSQLDEKRYLLMISRSVNTEDYLSRKRFIESLQSEKDSAIEDIRKVRETLYELHKDMMSLYDVHAQREGAKIAIQFNSNWQYNVDRLKFDNPTYKFEKIVTQNAFLRADAYSKNNILPGASILSFNISGMSNLVSPVAIESYPESFAGSATINLLAACPMIYPQWFALPAGADMSDPRNMKFSMMVGYNYPAEFSYSLKMTYNLYKLYEMTQSQGKRGGFLSTKSWSDKEENEYYRDGFKVEWANQSPQLQLTPDQKAAIEKDLRRGLMARVAAFMVLSNPTPRLPDAPDAQLPGAIVLSDSLSKNCGINLTCKAASMGLRLIFDVFSSTSISQSYRQKINVEATETYTNKQILLQPMLTTYL